MSFSPFTSERFTSKRDVLRSSTSRAALSRRSWSQTLRLARTPRHRRAFLPLCALFALSNFLPGGFFSSYLAAGLAENSASAQTAPVSESASLNAIVVQAKNGAPISDTSNTTVKTDVVTTSNIRDVVIAAPAIGKTMTIRAIADGRSRRATITLAPDAQTVGDALKAANITLQPLDRVQPNAKTRAYPNMTIRVTRIRAALRTRRETLNPETFFRPTTEIGRGQTQRIQIGLPGTRTVVERVWSKDGKVTMRERVSNSVTLAPRSTIVALGTGRAYLPGRIPYHKRYARSFSLQSRAGSPRERFRASGINSSTRPLQVQSPERAFRAVRSINLVATGYSPDPRENGGYTVTATGLPIGYGAAAVDPRVIPLGTKLYVEGYGYAFACDVGGAIKGHRIDLAYDSYYLANTKGRKKVRAWILK